MRGLKNEPDDRTLVLRVFAGDAGAFAVLFRRYRASLLRLCGRILGAQDDAQDIAQEATLQAYLRLRTLNEPDRFGAWLHSIAANLARSELRKRRGLSFESLHGREGYGEALVDASPGPEEVRLARELNDEIVAALDGLSEVNREAVTGYYLKGQSYAELAVLRGVPVSTIKGRLHKGRTRLKPHLIPVARQVLGYGLRKEKLTGETEKLVEVVVDDVIKGVGGDDQFFEALKTGSMAEYHAAGSSGYERLPKAAVLLRQLDGERVLPIYVGSAEGLGIWRSISGWEPPRPFTHELMGQALKLAGLRVQSAAVRSLVDNVFYGEIILSGGDASGREHKIDSRPSDAISLAVRADAPIFVAEKLFAEDGCSSKETFLGERKGELGLE